MQLSLANVGLIPVVTAKTLLGAEQPSADLQATTSPLKIVCVGAHPDDPESGCGGTLALYSEMGHRVTVIYLTRGERGIPGKSLEESARIRTAEAEAACKIIGAKPVFAGQIDGATEVSRSSSEAFAKLLSAEEANIVFTQWPIDTHPDHQAASILTIRAYVTTGRKFALYFFEVNRGSQTLAFSPTDYVDITSSREKKKACLFVHKSQNGEQIYRNHLEIMEDFRGREAGMKAAEAFIRLVGGGSIRQLPFRLFEMESGKSWHEAF
jgi:LmbE family N-acetylglucosaminyl deacetylase